MRAKKLSLVLVFLAVINAIGGVGLALVVDFRFIWVAIVVPAGAVVGILALRYLGGRSANMARTRPGSG